MNGDQLTPPTFPCHTSRAPVTPVDQPSIVILLSSSPNIIEENAWSMSIEKPAPSVPRRPIRAMLRGKPAS